MIYLLADEKRNGTLFKVGYTTDLDTRKLGYSTHNAGCRLVEYAITYQNTKCKLEKQVQEEIMASLKYKFVRSEIAGKMTEWFFVPAEEEKEFLEKGLRQFKACRGRKIFRAI